MINGVPRELWKMADVFRSASTALERLLQGVVPARPRPYHPPGTESRSSAGRSRDPGNRFGGWPARWPGKGLGSGRIVGSNQTDDSSEEADAV
jgi:hypothetical protein